MGGGIAVRGNLLAVAFSAAKGHVVLVDVDARRRVAGWRLPDGDAGWSDAAGVAMDERYHVFVADAHNDRVLEYAPFGRLVRSYGEPPPARGDAARDRVGVLDRPHAVAVRQDVVFVACGEQPRRRAVQRWTRLGVPMRPLACRGEPDAKFGAPRGLWADPRGLVVADTLHGELQEFRIDGTFVRAVATAPAGAQRPTAVARDGDGAFWFVSDGVVHGLLPDGRPAPMPPFGDQCVDVVGLAIDEFGRFYVQDRHGDRVQRFARDGAAEGVWFDADDVAEPSA